MPFPAYAHRCTTTLFASPAAATVSPSASSVRFGNVVPIVYTRAAFSGRDLSVHQHPSAPQPTTYALIKLRMSPTVCERFIRHGILQQSGSAAHSATPDTYLVPSANRICTVVVGCV